MYSNENMVKELTFLVENNTSITDAEIRSFIRRAEAKINQWLGNRYVVPIVPADDIGYPDGTISGTSGATTITGTSTTFASDIAEGSVIYITDTKEALRIGSVGGDTAAESEFNIVNTFSASTYFVIPPEIATVSEYLASHLLIITHFSEMAYNQQTESWNTQFKSFAEPLLKQIECGDYFNNSLKEQTIAQTIRRQGHVITNTTFRSQVAADETSFFGTEFI